MLAVDTESAIERLMHFLAVEGVTGREARIGKALVSALKEAGVPGRSIRFDDAHTRIPLPTEIGNLIVDLPGRGALEAAERLLFMTHMDTVPLCAGAKPKRQAKKIVNAAKAALKPSESQRAAQGSAPSGTGNEVKTAVAPAAPMNLLGVGSSR